MININRNNYEEYFIDYLDGNLSQTDKQQVFIFLEQNPDLKEELEMFQQEALVPEDVFFEGKQDLKRARLFPSDNHFDELCIASIEGDLTKNEQAVFDHYLGENAEKHQEFLIYTKIKLKANKAIVFSEKNKLKRSESKPFTRKLVSIISAAASVAIIVGLYLLLPEKTEYSNNQQISQQIKLEDEAVNIEDNKQSSTSHFKERENTMSSLKTRENKLLPEINVEEYSIAEISSGQDKKLNPEVKGIVVPKKLKTVEVKYAYTAEIGIPYLADVTLPDIELENRPEQKENYHTLKTFLASTFNKRMLNKEEKDKIEFFDIAQAGVKGINRLTGSNMKLERKYDQNGNLDKTEFNSRLVAFSAPVKKK